MDSIGAILKTRRESRGLSVEDAHESTKITVQNISALESDRFDSFPNKVYARAFLRDYANFLELDSAGLLTQYEEQWTPRIEPQPDNRREHRSVWRILGYAALVLILVGVIGLGGYVGWNTLQRQHKQQRDGQGSSAVATIPKAPEVVPPKPEAPAKPAPAAAVPAVPVAPKTQTLEVTTLGEVWLRIVADGTTAYIGIMPKGQTKTVQGKVIAIRAGKAGAVQLKLNGRLQPPLGSLREAKTKVFTMPQPPASGSGAMPAPAGSTAAP